MSIDLKKSQRDWDELLPNATYSYQYAPPQDSTEKSTSLRKMCTEVSIPADLATGCSKLKDEADTDSMEAL